ncbi:MAG: hypothetical protein JWQ63_3444 [Mucilaginibacter sp.]|jgi:hypothetical protein|nr:hypothetical protein [Mucilaginibacter sp.]
METYDIITNIEIGQQIFENIPNDIRPDWAGLILSRFDSHIKNIPGEIKEIYSIIDSRERWMEAHEQFNKIRVFLLNHKNYQPESYLHLAEMVAKVTYNSSVKPSPFDKDNGWYIASLALKTAQFFDDDRLEEEVKSAILIFNRNKKFTYNLIAAKDFLVYKKIDEILWFDWDPIGVNKDGPRDEYQSYVPRIFELKKSGAEKQKIAEYLFTVETERMGMGGTFENCLNIADKIIKAS